MVEESTHKKCLARRQRYRSPCKLVAAHWGRSERRCSGQAAEPRPLGRPRPDAPVDCGVVTTLAGETGVATAVRANESLHQPVVLLPQGLAQLALVLIAH